MADDNQGLFKVLLNINQVSRRFAKAELNKLAYLK